MLEGWIAPVQDAWIRGRVPPDAVDVGLDEHAARGRRISRRDFAQTAPIAQFENRFPVPNAASGGARP